MSFKKFMLIIAACAACTNAETKTAGWLIDVDANVTLTQNAYSDSWIGGEKGALSWASKCNIVAEKQLSPWYLHRNTLKLAYGQTKNQGDDKSWGDFAKSTDLIDFESLQRLTMGKWVEPFLAVRIISQFIDERDSLNPHYGNPMDIYESFGASRSLVTKDALKWDARLGGAVQQAIDRYMTNPATGKHEFDVINNAGIEFVTEMKAHLRDGLMDYKTLLTVFEALASSAEEVKGFDGTPAWRYPDINWENDLSVNLSKYVMINFTLQLLYDKEKQEKARIKEVMALGLMYKFNNAPKAAK